MSCAYSPDVTQARQLHSAECHAVTVTFLAARSSGLRDVRHAQPRAIVTTGSAMLLGSRHCIPNAVHSLQHATVAQQELVSLAGALHYLRQRLQQLDSTNVEPVQGKDEL